mmetsp:Transcript_123419/g.263175  ORF Transcript_123419/g.263175 Transcript_123419/m.263175 type:complete len:310 (+) Transcript_123419:1450-2379(+)
MHLGPGEAVSRVDQIKGRLKLVPCHIDPLRQGVNLLNQLADRRGGHREAECPDHSAQVLLVNGTSHQDVPLLEVFSVGHFTSPFEPAHGPSEIVEGQPRAGSTRAQKLIDEHWVRLHEAHTLQRTGEAGARQAAAVAILKTTVDGADHRILQEAVCVRLLVELLVAMAVPLLLLILGNRLQNALRKIGNGSPPTLENRRACRGLGVSLLKALLCELPCQGLVLWHRQLQRQRLFTLRVASGLHDRQVSGNQLAIVDPHLVEEILAIHPQLHHGGRQSRIQAKAMSYRPGELWVRLPSHNAGGSSALHPL